MSGRSVRAAVLAAVVVAAVVGAGAPAVADGAAPPSVSWTHAASSIGIREDPLEFDLSVTTPETPSALRITSDDGSGPTTIDVWEFVGGAWTRVNGSPALTAPLPAGTTTAVRLAFVGDVASGTPSVNPPLPDLSVVAALITVDGSGADTGSAPLATSRHTIAVQPLDISAVWPATVTQGAPAIFQVGYVNPSASSFLNAGATFPDLTTPVRQPEWVSEAPVALGATVEWSMTNHGPWTLAPLAPSIGGSAAIWQLPAVSVPPASTVDVWLRVVVAPGGTDTAFTAWVGWTATGANTKIGWQRQFTTAIVPGAPVPSPSPSVSPSPLPSVLPSVTPSIGPVVAATSAQPSTTSAPRRAGLLAGFLPTTGSGSLLLIGGTALLMLVVGIALTVIVRSDRSRRASQ